MDRSDNRGRMPGLGGGINRRTAVKGIGASAALAALLGYGPTSALAQYGVTAGKVFQGAWPYDVPPVGHYNTFPGIPRSINLGIYNDLMQMPLAMYYWASGDWMPLMATGWEMIPDQNTFQVRLRQGVKWSDGSNFSAKDLIDTYMVRRLLSQAEWRYLDRVDAVDDYTVNFVMAKPSTVVERYVLHPTNGSVSASSVYGMWADKVRDLVKAGKDDKSDEWKKLRQDFTDYKPKEMVVTGPYKIDPKSITDAELTLVKNTTSWANDRVLFDKIRLFNGETPIVTPIVLSKDVDYATHGFPPATEKAFKDLGMRIFRPPTFGGGAVFFNYAKVPAIQPKEVRQAMAHIIRRDVGGAVALGESGEAIKNIVGYSERLAKLWLTPETRDMINPYNYDPARAEELMTGAGYSRGADGVWVSPAGERMEYELTVAAEFADNSALAQAVSEQLTDFGIKTSVRLINFNQVDPDVEAGNFQMVIRGWGAAHPHPQFSFVQDMQRYNPPISNGPGMAFPLTQTVDALGGEVNLDQMIVDSADGLDTAKQRDIVNQLSLAFNELLPCLPVYERLGNNPTAEGLRVKGWPPDGDPIYDNSPYADSFVVMLMLEGRLRPA